MGHRLTLVDSPICSKKERQTIDERERDRNFEMKRRRPCPPLERMSFDGRRSASEIGPMSPTAAAADAATSTTTATTTTTTTTPKLRKKTPWHSAFPITAVGCLKFSRHLFDRPTPTLSSYHPPSPVSIGIIWRHLWDEPIKIINRWVPPVHYPPQCQFQCKFENWKEFDHFNNFSHRIRRNHTKSDIGDETRLPAYRALSNQT